MQTPNPYRTALQATAIARTADASSAYQAQLDAAARAILLDAWRTQGNKAKAAQSLGLTYRAFRYHWARLALDSMTKSVSE